LDEQAPFHSHGHVSSKGFTPTHTQTVIFSIIVNGNSLGQAVARTVIDQIVEALVELRDC